MQVTCGLTGLCGFLLVRNTVYRVARNGGGRRNVASMTLQRLVVNRLADLDISIRQAANRSRGMVSHSTISKIVRGEWNPRRPRDELFAGLALALEVSEREL